MNFLRKLFGMVDNDDIEKTDDNQKKIILDNSVKKTGEVNFNESKKIKKKRNNTLTVEENNLVKNSELPDYMLYLNKYQKEAIVNDDDACIVSANVGSGKTTVLISKVLYLTQKYDINDLIILTFTNKAAQEIKDRLISENNDLSTKKLSYCGTFHSVALTLLKEKLPVTELGYTSDFSVITPDEELDIANEIIFDYNLKIKYKNRLAGRLEKEKQAYFDGSVPKYNDDLFKLYDLLRTEKLKQNKMSFDDLISNAIILLKKHKLHPKWIIIDEFQDSSTDLLNLIDGLRDSKTKVFVVGDENQMIYGWRNTNKDVFNIFKSKYNATMLSLPINYRSTKSILEVAKSILNKPLDLVGTRELENKIKIKKHYNSFNEAQYLSEQIKNIIALGNNYNDIAILYRTQKQSEILSDVFDNCNIPYEVSCKKTLSSIPVLCWFLSLLKCSINTSDVMNMTKVVTDLNYGINLTKVQAKKCFSGVEKNEFINKIYKFNSHKFNSVFEIYDYYSLDVNMRPTSASFEYDKNLIMVLLEKINNLILDKKLSIKDGISEFINYSALYGVNILNENINIEKNCVKLMTLHASKGLEFKYVFIIGANDGLIPLMRSYDSKDELDEEMRLFFVGITRAKDFLEISYYINPEEPRVFDSPSKFLEEIPRNLVETEDNEIFKTNSLSKLKKQVGMNQSSLESLDELFDGKNSTKKIKHPRYGVGQIVQETEDILVVDFEKYGKKEFLKDLEIYEYVD